MIARRRSRRPDTNDSNPADVVLAYPAGRPGNPYTALLYGALTGQGWRVDDLTFTPRAILRSKLPTVLHVHWPEQVAATRTHTRAWTRLLCYATLLLRCRIARRPVVWTVHNLHPHDSPYRRVAQAAIALTRWSSSGVVFMSRVAEARFRQRYLRSPASLIVRHGDLSIEYAPLPKRSEARRQLGVDPEAVLIVAFGHVRAYKNLGQLLEAFRSVDDARWQLLVVGKADALSTRLLQRVAKLDKRILLDLKFQSNGELGAALAASDLVCIPFSEVLHSGSAHLAASAGRSVLVPDIGSLREMEVEFANGQMIVYRPPLTGATLAAGVADALRSRERPGLCEAQEWKDIAASHIDFFKDLAALR